MRTIFLYMLLLLFGISSFGQKMIGLGGELSVLGLRPNVRTWVSKTIGFEVFGGVSAELSDFKLNDYEGGFKYLNTFLYNHTDRTYFGLVGKWKWVKSDGSEKTANLPVVGILIGKEWSKKRIHRKGFAIELGYQYGTKKYDIHRVGNPPSIAHKTYDEFPLIVNLRYSFYKKK